MRAVALLLLAGCALASTGCAHALNGAERERGVQLPRDHAAHDDAQTEWWHLHGHVQTDDGRRFDWFFGFVKQHTDLDRVAFLPVHWFVDPFYTSYFTVTDRSAGTFHVREKHAFPDVWAASCDSRQMSMRHDSWSARRRDDGVIDLQANTLQSELTVQLTPLKPPALLGDGGYLHVPPRSSHYYYSIPRMAAEGTLIIDGERHQVRGLAWLKHEWGFLYTDQLEGWLWFGVQLSSGQELEIGLIYDKLWNLAPGAFAVVEESDGSVTPLPVSQLDIRESGDIWRSPRTDTVYPTGWSIDIPGRGHLVLKAAVAGQEMVVFPANLWAGGVEVSGYFDGAEVTGDAFVELLGLDAPFGRSWFESGRPEEATP